MSEFFFPRRPEPFLSFRACEAGEKSCPLNVKISRFARNDTSRFVARNDNMRRRSDQSVNGAEMTKPFRFHEPL